MERRCVTTHRLRRLVPHSPPLRGSSVLSRSPVHPRACGAVPQGAADTVVVHGRSPRGRGILVEAECLSRVTGRSPRARSADQAVAKVVPFTVFPHACRVASHLRKDHSSGTGPSPRTRGARSDDVVSGPHAGMCRTGGWGALLGALGALLSWLYLPDRICLRTLLTTYFGRSFLSAGMTIGRAAPFFTYTLCDPLVRSRRQPCFSTSFARSRDDVIRTSLSGARAVDTGSRAVLQVCSQARPRLVSAARRRADNRGIANSIRRRF